MSPNDRTPPLAELVRTLKSKLLPIFKKYSCRFAYLGGSWAKDRAKWWSDIDVFVSMPNISQISDKKRFSLLVTLNREVEQATGNSPIDIRVLELLPIHVQFRVITEGILLYEQTKTTRLDYKEYIMKLYYDHIIWYEQLLDASLKA